MSSHPLIVIGGPTGAGKTTVGQLLAARLELPFCDGDSLHSRASVQRMQAGLPLDDAARAPWLARVGGWLADHADSGGVMACSALARRYRDMLRGEAPEALFALLVADPELLAERLARRPSHFMPASLVKSQVEVYEPPRSDEAAAEFSGHGDAKATADEIAAWAQSLSMPTR